MKRLKNLFVKAIPDEIINTMIPDPETSAQRMSAPSGQKKSLQRLDNIAAAGLQLASLGPQLASMAAEMEKNARSQAKQAAVISEVMGEFTNDLNDAVSQLRASSGDVADALGTVSRIAQHTRIISINASIEAARAGEYGRAFGVVVDEVQRLANGTGNTTDAIADCIRGMQQSITQVAVVAGSENAAGEIKKNKVDAVNCQIQGMVNSVNEQLGSAECLQLLGEQINGHTERLILDLGTFRFDAHKLAENEVARMLPLLDGHVGERQYCEKLFERWLGDCPSFELLYITDGQGRQYIDNIASHGGSVIHDPAGYGRDWSRRPWYLDAIRNNGIHSTDIYRSTATGDFCFTVAYAFRDARKNVCGVIGADVNFKRLIEH